LLVVVRETGEPGLALSLESRSAFYVADKADFTADL